MARKEIKFNLLGKRICLRVNISKWLHGWYKRFNIKRLLKAPAPEFEITMYTPWNSYHGKLISYFGVADKEYVEFIHNNIKIGKDKIALDIGAEIGWISMVLNKIADGGRVISFEPNPNTYSILQTNIAANNAVSVTAVNLALMSSTQTQTMFLKKGNIGENSLIQFSNKKKTIKVKGMSLNEYLQEKNIAHEQICFMKIDVEGAELEVLLGATLVLDTCPIIMMEWSPKFWHRAQTTSAEICQFLESYGYTPHYLIRGYLHKAHPESLNDETQTDIFWTK